MEREAESLETNKEYIVHLLREVEKFLRQNETAPTRFGREAVVFDLRNGRDPRPQTVRRVLAYQTGP